MSSDHHGYAATAIVNACRAPVNSGSKVDLWAFYDVTLKIQRQRGSTLRYHKNRSLSKRFTFNVMYLMMTHEKLMLQRYPGGSIAGLTVIASWVKILLLKTA